MSDTKRDWHKALYVNKASLGDYVEFHNTFYGAMASKNSYKPQTYSTPIFSLVTQSINRLGLEMDI